MRTEKTNPNVFSFKNWLITYFEKHPKCLAYVSNHNEYFLRKWMPTLSDTLQREYDSAFRQRQLDTIRTENNAKYSEQEMHLPVGGDSTSDGEVTV